MRTTTAEIESEFPGSSNSEDDDSLSKRSTEKARNDIRTSYNNALEEGSINFSSQSVGSGGSYGNNSSYGKGGKVSSGVARLNLRRSSIDEEEEPAAAGLTVAGFNMEPLARVSILDYFILCLFVICVYLLIYVCVYLVCFLSFFYSYSLLS